MIDNCFVLKQEDQMSVTLHRIRSCFRSVLVLFAVFFAPTVVAAQGGGIAGTVTDEASGSALSAVQVEVVNASGAVVAEGITGPSGSFRINDIPSGNYTVRSVSYTHLTLPTSDLV